MKERYGAWQLTRKRASLNLVRSPLLRHSAASSNHPILRSLIVRPALALSIASYFALRSDRKLSCASREFQKSSVR